MTSNTTKCPYCRRGDQQAAAYENHLPTMHLEIVLSLHANADLTSPGPPALLQDENIKQSDLDHESDYRLEIADCRSAGNEIDDDMQNDSDAEDVSHSPVCGRPSSQETISGTGRALSNVADYTKLNRAMTDDPWNAFSSEDNFNLASWLVRSKVAKSPIDAYFAQGLGGTDSRSFRSAYTRRQHLNVLDPFGEYLVWTEPVIDDGRHAASFYYPDIIDCDRYLICQVAYRSDMVYAPLREYDSSGERVYSEMHRADSWWDTQV